MTFQRLVKFLIENEFLETEDRLVIKDVVYKLELDLETFEDVNEKIKGQIKIEADLVYLLGKYRDACADLRFDVDEEEADVFLKTPKRNEDGYRTSGQELKAYQTADPEVAIKRRRLQQAESLYESLQLLCRVVFARNSKLEQLSVNYRKEIQTDR
jgi:hypothetical protein